MLLDGVGRLEDISVAIRRTDVIVGLHISRSKHLAVSSARIQGEEDVREQS